MDDDDESQHERHQCTGEQFDTAKQFKRTSAALGKLAALLQPLENVTYFSGVGL